MARVIAWVPDLLFGSNVLGALKAGGHEAVLLADPARVAGELASCDVLVVDLTYEAAARVEVVGAFELAGTRTLAFYSHVDADVRALAEQAGFDKVVPRSRMAREGAALVTGLAGE